ncbi:MAG: carbohydrate ABC transporter permease [Bacteroidetes bacterium]|nr:carbohydrate ABC transporter permease [Bacteroidota bacterium]
MLNVKANKTVRMILLILLAIVMIYPLLWLFASSFKTDNEIYSSFNLIPKEITTEGYVKGWNGIRNLNFLVFIWNTVKLVIPTVIFTIISSVLVGYGFARFEFPLKKILFWIMLSSLMLPGTVLIIPRYIIFQKLGWIDSYLPFYVPALLGCYPFFIFMMVQFVRGMPKELDESAIIDGCNSFSILTRILIPLMKPAIFSVAIFQFIWTWNSFFDVLIYISSTDKFPIALALRMYTDVMTSGGINRILAMTVLSIIPSIIIFFSAQKYFIEGIATTGIKG